MIESQFPSRLRIGTFAFISLIVCSGCGKTSFPPGHLFRPTAAEVVSSPAAFDFDKDGQLEIAIGSLDGKFYLLDDSLRSLSGWPQQSEAGFFSSPALWDVNRDSIPEIFAGSENGRLSGWHWNGKTVHGFPVDLGGECRSSPTIVADSMIAIAGYETMHVLDRHGQAVSGWPQPMKGWAAATAAWHDDLLAISSLTSGESSRGYLYAWHLSGELYANFPVRLKMDSSSSPALADLDNDGRPEIVVGDDAGYLHAFRLDGSELPPFPRRLSESIQNSPAITDLDQDGIPDIVVGTDDGAVHAWNANGDCLLGWPFKTGARVTGSPAIIALGFDSVGVVIGSGDHNLYALHADGGVVNGFPIDCGDGIHSSPLIADLDGNGKLEIVVGANNGIHLIRNVLSATGLAQGVQVLSND